MFGLGTSQCNPDRSSPRELIENPYCSRPHYQSITRSFLQRFMRFDQVRDIFFSLFLFCFILFYVVLCYVSLFYFICLYYFIFMNMNSMGGGGRIVFSSPSVCLLKAVPQTFFRVLKIIKNARDNLSVRRGGGIARHTPTVLETMT